MGVRGIGISLLIIAAILVGIVLYRNSFRSEVPLVFSPTQVLNATWTRYVQDYLGPDSRTIDTSRNNVTTSEGESYTMLRAVWVGDKKTFDASWKFTQDNLQHTSGDALFSWLFGKEPGGAYGVLTGQGGSNSASDADEDIALSLVFAYGRWQDPAYLTAARAIIQSIWDNEVVTVNGTPYLTADNLEKTSTSPVALINPSYLSPYSYRIFAEVDPTHPWGELVQSSYRLLGETIAAPLGSGKSAGLPPDWVAVNKTTGALSAAAASGTDSNFGYDALRVPFRLALDYEWFGDSRDLAILNSMGFLKTTWQSGGALASTYSHSGGVVNDVEAPAFYGGTIGYFLFADSGDAQKVYEQKLVFLYNPDLNGWKETLSYYDDNWAWFGIALYNHLLPNLTKDLSPAALSS